METTRRDIRRKILESGLFKLDDSNKPVGLLHLASGTKDLWSERCHIGSRRKISARVSELAEQIRDYLKGPRNWDPVASQFERGLQAFLEKRGLTAEDLEPHYTRFLKKAKRQLMKNLSADELGFLKFLDLYSNSTLTLSHPFPVKRRAMQSGKPG